MATNRITDLEDARIDRLEALISEIYDFEHPDEIECAALAYDESTTRILEVIYVGREVVCLIDIMEDDEFHDVRVPAELTALLRAEDAFLTTLGRTGETWTVISFGPRYETWEFDEDEGEENFEIN